MFDKVLVANRGEIAVRVMRACEDLGISTVAVYSDADTNGEHVHYAEEAYNVGPARAADSYLDQEQIIAVAERAGADAIHPGYGFLAENAEFATRVEAHDEITWVGPSSESMERLGEKTRARTAMQEAGVPLVPGTTEPIEDVEEVEQFGEEHGYPIAIKAEGGGGGRGMKIVEEPDEIEEQLAAARREGKAYFDDDSVYLERYLDTPRHVEVQILADEHGNVRHLGERDCSLQRRHQKVIEEGPSPALSAGLREKICNAARKGADTAGYVNAGTFEFLVEEDRDDDEPLEPDTDFYFLEVNTRIQVEHCVTEALTGIDIVKWQLRIAAGEQLDFTQDDIELDGHAIEYRINAENAAESFSPATGGHLETYAPPEGIGIRMEDAVRQGDELVTDYDSMIGKLVVHGKDRQECINRSKRALSEFAIEGFPTIVPFHRLMLTDEAFLSGRHTTSYVDDELETSRIAEAQQKWGTDSTATTIPDGYASFDCIIEVDGERRESMVYLDPAEFGGTTDKTSGSTTRRDFSSSTSSRSGSKNVDTTRTQTPKSSTENTRSIGDSSSSSLGGADGQSHSTQTGELIEAEMQGTVLDVPVSEGDEVETGDTVCVLEAMKMENDIVAKRGGVVDSVAVEAGSTVDVGDTLVVIE